MDEEIVKEYKLLSGEIVSLEDLKPTEMKFLQKLQKTVYEKISYFIIYRTAIGPGSIALEGMNQVNKRILKSPLYLIVRDITTRAGIDQGLILAPEYENIRSEVPQDFSMISVIQASNILGISLESIIKEIENGNIVSRKFGNVTLIEKESVLKYKENFS